MQPSVGAPAFKTLGSIPSSGIARSRGSSVRNLSEDAPKCLPQWLHHCTLPTARRERP